MSVKKLYINALEMKAVQFAVKATTKESKNIMCKGGQLNDSCSSKQDEGFSFKSFNENNERDMVAMPI